MPRRTIAIVPHTHWDREWYEPFQTFRLALVDLLDRLLPLMEQDPSYRRFLLDGQMAVVDDYLEVRPEAEERIRRLAASGRLEMGPWYILMDEFLVSGETIIRDLQLGLRRGAEFGGAMSVGYLPDMFGHIAQMPQILRLAGLEDAVLWRGVPSAVTKTGFTWIAPDGSAVRAEYLPIGYGNGAALPSDAKALVERALAHEQEIGEFLLGDLLWMNGSDHLHPQVHLGRVVAEANAMQDELHFEVSSLPEYLARAPRGDLEVWRGELRSGFRSNMLMGVTSNRVDVKVAAARAERALERRAEPLHALFGHRENWPARLLDLAWREVIRNSAHDSICACSVDEVVDAVLHRFAEARQIGEGLASRGLATLAASLEHSTDAVVNLSQFERGGVVELVLTGDEIPDAAVQLLHERVRFPAEMELDGSTFETFMSLLQGSKIDNDTWIQEALVEDLNDGRLRLAVALRPTESPSVDLDAARRELYTKLGANPELRVLVQLDQPRIRRVAALVGPVAGFGWAPFTPVVPAHPATLRPVQEQGQPSVELTNGLATVLLDPIDGTFSINGQPGFGRLVDQGDLGDSYNYSPPASDLVISAPEVVAVEAGLQGPVRATATIRATYHWPTHIDGGRNRRAGMVPVEVTTTVELRADDPAVHVAVEFVNPARDHRLRIHLPLPTPASNSIAECAFTTVARDLTAEGRPDEFGLPTFPCRRFVAAGGLTVVQEGLNEYELVDLDDAGTAHTLALTLLRSTGMLSRLGMKFRPFPAGPLTPVEGLQLVGRTITARYSIHLDAVDPWRFADEVLLPLEPFHAPGGGTRASAGHALEVEGAIVSAVQIVDGVLEVRVFNPNPEPSTVSFGLGRGWVVDLRGQGLEPFDGTFTLRGHGIATVRLDG